MLKVRIIPTLLWKNVGLVKGVRFDSWRRIGTLLPAVKVYNAREVDELIFHDIAATGEGRAPDFEAVYDVSPECFVPLTCGGGVRTLDDVRNLLRAGADKVSVNSEAYRRPEIVEEASRRFGSQCIVVGIDARRTPGGRYECLGRSGVHPTGFEPGDWACEMEKRGAGEILLTSIDRDGTMQGYDIDLVASVTSRVRIPVIASGGAGSYLHMYEVLTAARASAVAAASMFHFTEQTPLEAKAFLAGRGIPVRIVPRGH